MTETIQYESTAIFANVAERTLRTLLLPWGELSRQSPTTKPIRFAKSKVTVPRDISIVGANINHDHFSPVGRAAQIDDTDRGLIACFAIADTPEGDALLLAADEAEKSGKPLKVSPELRNIFRNGEEGISAELVGAGFVAEGAWQSAAVFSIALDEPPIETDEERISRLELELAEARLGSEPAPLPTDPEPAPAGPAEPPVIPAPTEEELPVGLPNTLGNKTGSPAAPEILPPTKREVFGIFEAIRSGIATEEMLDRLRSVTVRQGANGVFALNDVKYDGAGSVQPDERRATWEGQLWDGVTFARQVIPLLNHKTLTSKKVAGFRWTLKPKGATWAGNKSNIPSNQPTTAPANTTAEFWAMGHDHAIEHELFDTPGYWESYFEAGAEDYAVWSDDHVFDALIAAATSVEADNPAGLTIGAGFSALIDGASEVITTGKAVPTFALVAPALWKSMMKTPSNAVLGYLDAALGLEDGTLSGSGFVIRPYGELAAGNVLVGAREAATVYELDNIFRVQAPDTVKGGIDTNMIGATATLVHKATALQLVTPYTP